MKYLCPCDKKEIIESTHVHDFKRCSCGDVAVDGGDAYSRLIGSPDGKFATALDWVCPIDYDGCIENCGSYGCGN